MTTHNTKMLAGGQPDDGWNTIDVFKCTFCHKSLRLEDSCSSHHIFVCECKRKYWKYDREAQDWECVVDAVDDLSDTGQSVTRLLNIKPMEAFK